MGSMNEVRSPSLTALRIISKSSAIYFQDLRHAHFLLILAGRHPGRRYCCGRHRWIEPKDEFLNARSASGAENVGGADASLSRGLTMIEDGHSTIAEIPLLTHSSRACTERAACGP